MNRGRDQGMKPKEPLMALLLTLVFPGLGQIYSHHAKRGLAVIGISFGFNLAALPIALYVIDPRTRITMAVVMSFVILVLLGTIFGILVLIDAYRCAKVFNVKNALERKMTWGRRFLFLLGMVVVLCIPSYPEFIKTYIKTNIVQAFRFPSGSMELTIQPGDRLLADKAIYKKSKPQRGDVIVFKYPPNPERDFAKRLIAFSGETVEIRDGHVYVNGEMVAEPRIGKKYYYNRGEYGGVGKPVTVPAGQYYVLGDNSARSHDSRFFGFVPEENLIGKIYKIYWPMKRSGPLDNL